MSKTKLSLTFDLVTVEPENIFMEKVSTQSKKIKNNKKEDEKEALNLKISKKIYKFGVLITKKQ